MSFSQPVDPKLPEAFQSTSNTRRSQPRPTNHAGSKSAPSPGSEGPALPGRGRLARSVPPARLRSTVLTRRAGVRSYFTSSSVLQLVTRRPASRASVSPFAAPRLPAYFGAKLCRGLPQDTARAKADKTVAMRAPGSSAAHQHSDWNNGVRINWRHHRARPPPAQNSWHTTHSGRSVSSPPAHHTLPGRAATRPRGVRLR